MNRIPAKHIRTEKFSNKNFFIEIKLYEHGLARGHCVCKRCGMESKMWKSDGSPLLYFPDYHWMTIVEWNEFYKCFASDKTARRWVRRVMSHCFDGFLKPDGNIDHTKFAIEDDRRNGRSREYYRMNVKQLLLMKKLLPNFFYPGTFRTDNLPYTNVVVEVSSKEKYKSMPPNILNNPVVYRKFLQARLRLHKRYIPVEQLKEFVKVFDPIFFKQICEERTMNDCNIEVEYKFLQGEKPEMRIFVQDNNYIEFSLPNE